MNPSRFAASLCLALLAAVMTPSAAQQTFEPKVGQPGKDVIWVPTTPELVEKMLDVAKVTPEDYVIDLGSGDGRNVIAAARRGARGLGVEYNPDMVALSTRLAAEAGVAGKATFVQGDMYAADFSQATVLALFLLPSNLDRLRPKFLELRPGTRIVLNTFGIPDWESDETYRVEGDCESWCEALLYIVPARAGGTWRMPGGELTLTQTMQRITGALVSNGVSTPVTNGRLRGNTITFEAGAARYTGVVDGNTITGNTSAGAAWTATRTP